MASTVLPAHTTLQNIHNKLLILCALPSHRWSCHPQHSVIPQMDACIKYNYVSCSLYTYRELPFLYVSWVWYLKPLNRCGWQEKSYHHVICFWLVICSLNQIHTSSKTYSIQTYCMSLSYKKNLISCTYLCFLNDATFDYLSITTTSSIQRTKSKTLKFNQPHPLIAK